MTDDIRGVAALVGAPARAVMLWSLLDGRCRPASELAFCANVSAQSASTHLAKLLRAGMLRMEARGRHRYYRLATTEVALAVEALATLAPTRLHTRLSARHRPELKYARRCYDHLAGELGVDIAQMLQRKGWLVANGKDFDVTAAGAKALHTFAIDLTALSAQKRALARQCLDWSERRPHIAGALGAALLDGLLTRRWVVRVRDTRSLRVTMEGRRGLNAFLGLKL